jgi:hypothetical protein
MKKNLLILIAGLMVLVSSCSKDFLDVNEVNPNSPSKVDAKLVLPAGLNAVATTMNNPRRFEFIYLWHGLWSISAGYSQPQVLTQYKLINSSYQNAFIEFYLAGNNLNSIEKSSSTDPKEVYFVAVAKIMKAYIFQNLVDCWGDVPYTEAFQAPENLKPAYTPQKEIYEDLVVQLDAAMKLIQDAPSSSTVITAGSDIMFGGDMQKWLKFANTLKLRILIHQADISGRTAYITEKIATTASIGYLGAGESAKVNPGYVVSQGKMNPFYETFYNNAGTSQSDGITYYFAGKDCIDFLKSTNDPRISRFFNSYTTTGAAAYEGNYFGLSQDELTPQASTSKLGYQVGVEGTMIGTPTKSSPILTDMESLFIQAEAAERGLIAGNPKALYESAVTQSFIYMGLTVTEAAAYLAQESVQVNYNSTSNKRQLIISQKWAALNGIAPVEIWTDYRRTGYPVDITFSIDPARSSDTPPVRLLYPQDEVNVNNDNYKAALAAQNWQSEFKTKIFWQTR